MKIAIDGPNGAGKSTVARAIAERLGCIYVDTGALYRAVGLYVLRHGVESEDAKGIEGLLPGAVVTIEHGARGQRVLLNGEDVSDLIRTPTVSIYASNVSKLPAVRAHLMELQRGIAATRDVVMDGRDIGTVVLPDAEVKVFLTASAEVRAKRRYDELVAKGQDVTYEKVLNDLIWRDKNDSERDVAPLRPADDAVTVNTTELSFDEEVSAVMAVVEKRKPA